MYSNSIIAHLLIWHCISDFSEPPQRNHTEPSIGEERTWIQVLSWCFLDNYSPHPGPNVCFTNEKNVLWYVAGRHWSVRKTWHHLCFYPFNLFVCASEMWALLPAESAKMQTSRWNVDFDIVFLKKKNKWIIYCWSCCKLDGIKRSHALFCEV